MQSCCRTRRRFLRPLPFPAAAERRLPALCLRLCAVRWPGLDRLLLPGGISGTQLGPARPGSHPHPPSLVSLGGVVILKRGLIFVDVVVGKKHFCIREKKWLLYHFCCVQESPGPGGAFRDWRFTKHKSELFCNSLLTWAAQVRQQCQVPRSGFVCVCVGTDGGGLWIARDCKGRLV